MKKKMHYLDRPISQQEVTAIRKLMFQGLRPQFYQDGRTTYISRPWFEKLPKGKKQLVELVLNND